MIIGPHKRPSWWLQKTMTNQFSSKKCALLFFYFLFVIIWPKCGETNEHEMGKSAHTIQSDVVFFGMLCVCFCFLIHLTSLSSVFFFLWSICGLRCNILNWPTSDRLVNFNFWFLFGFGFVIMLLSWSWSFLRNSFQFSATLETSMPTKP